MNLVDSSGWLEYFAQGPNANFFARPIEETKNLIVPVICLFEVFKKVIHERSESDALNAIACMQQGHVITLDTALSLQAAGLSLQYKLPMADSVILATAKAFDAVIWTQDADFEDMRHVKYMRGRGVFSEFPVARSLKMT